MLLDAATGVDTKLAGPSQQNVSEMQESTEPSQLEVLTDHGTRTGKIKQYRDKVVKFLDNLVTVAKSSYILEQQGRSSAENLAFAKEILFAAEDIEEHLEYLHMFGSRIIDEYPKNTTERTPHEEQQQEQQPSGLPSKKKYLDARGIFTQKQKQISYNHTMALKLLSINSTVLLQNQVMKA